MTVGLIRTDGVTTKVLYQDRHSHSGLGPDDGTSKSSDEREVELEIRASVMVAWVAGG